MKALSYLSSKTYNVKYILIGMLISTIFIAACRTQSGDIKIRSIGAPGELLIVMDSSLKNTIVKDRVVEFATQEFPCLPQPESTFRITFIDDNNFTGHFKSYRNILILNHNLLTKDEVLYETDKWANNQQVVKINFSGKEQFVNMLSENKEQIFNHLYYGDINTMSQANRTSADASTARYIKDKYNLSVTIPQGYRLVKDTLGFSWFRFDNLETIQSIIIHEFDLDTLKSLNTEDLVALRNFVSQQYVPGPNTSSYMTTETRLPVLTQRLINQKDDVIEMRGLWKVEGYFMGGPFVDYFLKDEANNKLIMVEGFVYAPKKQNKAYYVRQIESILHSLKLS